MKQPSKRVGAALVVAALAASYGCRAREPASAPAAEQPAAAPPAQSAIPARASVPDFTHIVDSYGPAVVNVSTTGIVNANADGGRPGNIDPGDPLFQFFRHFGIPQQQPPMVVRGLGSGFIVDPNGIILTNAHVVEGANDVMVKLTDKREFKAKVVGIDKLSDVAVLRIEAKSLPAVKIGDPSRIPVGSWVLAIGSPFGFENSATAGIVSARSRSLPNEGYVPFLQTDVAVNPGNSGGPLFDAAGEVIGINSQIYSGSGGYMGISFAIPIDVAMNVEHQLVTSGKVVRGRIGVGIQDVNQALAESFGLTKATGALVSSVEKGGPGAKAGLEPGDVILKLNGEEIASATDLPTRVAKLMPGAGAKLEVLRDHKKREIDVEIGEAPSENVASATQQQKQGGKLGLVLRPLAPQERKGAGVDHGVLVVGVNGPAARAGIQPGDVVLAVNGTPVKNADQLTSIVDKAGKHVALLVERGDAKLFVPLDLG